MTRRVFAVVVAAVWFAAASSFVSARQASPAPKADITGQWAAKFDTQVGEQSYTYDFVSKDGKLTGKLKGSLGGEAVDVEDGKVEGDKVTFAETLSFQGMDIRITYAGTIVTADEIKFTRSVGEFATEELVATRVKK